MHNYYQIHKLFFVLLIIFPILIQSADGEQLPALDLSILDTYKSADKDTIPPSLIHDALSISIAIDPPDICMNALKRCESALSSCNEVIDDYGNNLFQQALFRGKVEIAWFITTSMTWDPGYSHRNYQGEDSYDLLIRLHTHEPRLYAIKISLIQSLEPEKCQYVMQELVRETIGSSGINKPNEGPLTSRRIEADEVDSAEYVPRQKMSPQIKKAIGPCKWLLNSCDITKIPVKLKRRTRSQDEYKKKKKSKHIKDSIHSCPSTPRTPIPTPDPSPVILAQPLRNTMNDHISLLQHIELTEKLKEKQKKKKPKVPRVNVVPPSQSCAGCTPRPNSQDIIQRNQEMPLIK